MASVMRKDEGKYSPKVLKLKSSNVVSPSPSRDSVGSQASYQEMHCDGFQKRKSLRRKRSRWHILKKRLTKKGVVPVNKDHVRYELLSCIREGLKQIVSEHSEISAKRVLTAEDFRDVKRTTAKFEQQEFEFESYASSVFATIRQSIGIDEDHFMKTVAPVNLPYLEFISNSKSGQDFFLSHDMQFMFKSNRHRDVKFFLSMLQDYLQHFIAYPHSLLVKYIGCYSIKLKGKSKKYFLAMQSIFYPADRIEDRFDVKGCTAGRYQRPSDPESHIITVLKDQNFLDQELDFGDQGQWFVEQIKADSAFLCRLNCMDYSLLVGRQKKHVDEKQPENVSHVVDRIGKSISPTRKNKISLGSEGFGDTPAIDQKENHNNSHASNSGSAVCFSSASAELQSEYSVSHDAHETAGEATNSSTVIIPQVKPGIMFPRCLADGVEKFQVEHRRLLPRCYNALHIIDSKDVRYFLGIVDFLTRFDWRQKLAQHWKMIKYCCGPHSTKRPEVYQERFTRFLSGKVKKPREEI